jgi:hypothetical protein
MGNRLGISNYRVPIVDKPRKVGHIWDLGVEGENEQRPDNLTDQGKTGGTL